jgi:plasmid stabilization system protein ParE
MPLRVKWTSTAKRSFANQIDYLEENWGKKEIRQFITRVDDKVDHLSKRPLICPVIDVKRNIHRCVVVKQVSLFYRIKSTHIELLLFWDNRQNPSKLKL